MKDIKGLECLNLKKMKVKVKRLNELAQLPKKAHESDFCYDVVAVSEEEVAPNVWKYGLGLAFQVERDNQNPIDICIDFRPRSSVWKTGMVLSNSLGTLDEGYVGEVSAVFYHVNTTLPRYRVGDRIGQINLGFTQPMEFEVVENLNPTDRGANGYGSTGR